MTTIVAVRKHDEITIAADSLTTFGDIRLGAAHEPIMSLFITDYTLEGNFLRWNPTLPEVRHGEVWRLITPIFIHFGVLHLLFNMLWLMDLGAQVEYRQGTARLGWLVLVLALACNLGQFLVSGPNFGGMSGVVYGLIGYIWLRGTRDPASGLYLDKRNFFLAIAWFVYCYTGFAGPIGNTAHAVGLAVGLSWGFVSAQVVRRRKDTDGNRR